MKKVEIPPALEKSRVVAILRRTEARLAVETAEALLKGGISVIEVTLNTPGALEMLRAMRDVVGDPAVLGAGAVLHSPDCDCRPGAAAHVPRQSPPGARPRVTSRG